MSDSTRDQQTLEQNLLLAMALGWLVPGLGHIYMKKWRRGIICGTSIVLLFLIGLYLCQWTYTSWDDFPFYLIGKYGSGFVLYVQALLTTKKAIDFTTHFHYYEIGVLFISVSGLLNATTIFNLIDVKFGRSLMKELKEAEEQDDRDETETMEENETDSHSSRSDSVQQEESTPS